MKNIAYKLLSVSILLNLLTGCGEGSTTEKNTEVIHNGNTITPDAKTDSSLSPDNKSNSKSENISPDQQTDIAVSPDDDTQISKEDSLSPDLKADTTISPD